MDPDEAAAFRDAIRDQVAGAYDVPPELRQAWDAIRDDRRTDRLLTVDETVTCSSVVVDAEGDAYPCGALSRYRVARSDHNESYGINGGSDEACEDHLAETVAGMVDGDRHVHAIVAIRWDQ